MTDRSTGKGRLRALRHRFRGRLQLSTAAATVAALGLLSTTAFAALSPTARVEHQQTVFRGGGSDTSYEAMTALDTFYNQSPGCATVDTRIPSSSQGSTHLHDNSCVAEDINEPNTLSDPNQRLGFPPAGFAPDTTPVPQVSRRANYDHDVIMEYFPLGSSFGIRQLQRQDSVGAGVNKCGKAATAVGQGPPNPAEVAECPPLDFARSSRSLAPEEIAASGNGGLEAYGFAREALAWACIPSDTAGCGGEGADRNLTSLQISNIVKCAPGARLWSDVIPGAPAIPIRVYTAQAGSGTRSSWDTFTNGGTNTAVGRTSGPLNDSAFNGVPGTCAKEIFENNAAGIDPAEADGAFFYFSSARHSKPKSAGATVLGKVDGFSINAETVNGAVDLTTKIEGKAPHPYARTVYNVVRKNDPQGANVSKEVLEYLGPEGFLCKADAQQAPGFGAVIDIILRKEGFFRPPFAKANNTINNQLLSYCRINIP